MARKFSELEAKMSPEAHSRAKDKAKKMLAEMALDELRAARHMTQEHLAEVLGVKQSSISKVERRADMYLSTLATIIRAMGGRLEIRAIFPDGDVKIRGLQAIGELPAALR